MEALPERWFEYNAAFVTVSEFYGENKDHGNSSTQTAEGVHDVMK